ncbi:MAG: 16S rRNA (cytidine(1402)-2'-O)-methyltransferase [Candidatus Saganbacteria bacterium]|nr:16S rRNA (cytidine(1402)-2'-O)-methyltransferase [Candidatus Saganbacteria bacterium]
MASLFVCATPIGNLEDSSLRLIRTLKEADLIAAEDTRQTKKLLEHFEIRTKTTSYHKFNIKEKSKYLIGQLLDGKNVALVSDAGMPGISDPGEELIKEAIDNNIQVVVIPGPSAIINALAGSGLSTKRFVFEGFLPSEGKGRRRILRKLVDEERTVIIYESPHRLLKTLKDIKDILGDRNICIARELTKKFEEIFRGTVEEATEHFSSKEILGEITIVIAGATS